MRWAFGLGGLLITIGVIVFLIKYISVPDIQAARQAQNYADRTVGAMTGRDPNNGQTIKDTYQLYPDTRSDGKLQDFQVTQITAGSRMETFYGLKLNDVILAAYGEGDFKWDMNGNTEQDARTEILEACMDGRKLVVQRGNQQLTLPAAPARPAAQQAQQNQQQRQGQSEGGVDDTMDAIRQRMHPVGMN